MDRMPIQFTKNMRQEDETKFWRVKWAEYFQSIFEKIVGCIFQLGPFSRQRGCFTSELEVAVSYYKYLKIPHAISFYAYKIFNGIE